MTAISFNQLNPLVLTNTKYIQLFDLNHINSATHTKARARLPHYTLLEIATFCAMLKSKKKFQSVLVDLASQKLSCKSETVFFSACATVATINCGRRNNVKALLKMSKLLASYAGYYDKNLNKLF